MTNEMLLKTTCYIDNKWSNWKQIKIFLITNEK